MGKGDLDTIRKKYSSETNKLNLALKRAQQKPASLTPFGIRFMIEEQGFASEKDVYKKFYQDYKNRGQELKNILNGWGKLAKYKLQPICEFYRDQLKFINPKIKTKFIYPSMDLKKFYDDSFFLSFDGIVWTGSSLNIYDNTKEIKNQISLMKKLSQLVLLHIHLS